MFIIDDTNVFAKSSRENEYKKLHSEWTTLISDQNSSQNKVNKKGIWVDKGQHYTIMKNSNYLSQISQRKFNFLIKYRAHCYKVSLISNIINHISCRILDNFEIFLKNSRKIAFS